MPDVSGLRSLKGISERRAALLQKLGVESLTDLYFFYPRLYEDWSKISEPEELSDGEPGVFKATVARDATVNRYGRKSTIRAQLKAGSLTIRAVWFNQPWLSETLKAGTTFLFRGQIEKKGTQLQIMSPQFVKEGQDLPPLLPIYRMTAGLTQKIVRDAISQALNLGHLIPQEFLPKSLRLKHRMAERRFAFQSIHFPADKHALSLSLNRFKYEELFLAKLALSVMAKRRELDALAPTLENTDEAREALTAWLSTLPYTLTSTQKRSLDEIVGGISKPTPMHRLLQGDVGSGKTVVAAGGILFAAKASGQSAFLAPTAVLARQHYETLQRLFEGTGLTLALLTGQMPAAKRRAVLEGLSDGSIDVAVGTHALLEPDVQFKNLTFAITDEQHRFGVLQRQRLLKEDEKRRPHLLVMSATPIPRTLALIVYGDLDVSVIEGVPPGRPEIKTYTARSTDRQRVEGIIEKTAARGEQIYVVCPLIEQSAAIDLQAVTDVYMHLKTRFPDLEVGLLHGSLKAKEKDQVMERFISGETAILVSTTVIEVGIDHPNATLMVIENAERFGLAQLHQLRGRVGRGHLPGLCILMSDTNVQASRKRLVTLCKNRDGFRLAEADLEQRGPGDFFGTRQHGLPEFRLVNLYEEKHLIDEVAEDVEAILAADPLLSAPEHRLLLPAIGERFGEQFMNLVL